MGSLEGNGQSRFQLNLCKRGIMTSIVLFPSLKITSKDQNDTGLEEKE